MNTKVCSKCACHKPCSEYYATRYMSDGYTSQCKQCMRTAGTLRRRRAGISSLIALREQARVRMEKLCKRCGMLKRLGEFGRHHSSLDGSSTWCNSCIRSYGRERRRQRGILARPTVRTRTRKLCYSCKEWKTYSHFAKDVRTLDGHTAACRACHKSRKLLYNATPKAAAVRRRRRQWRRANELQFRLVDLLRVRTRAALQGVNKSARTLELLGCTVDQLKQHLEAQFEPGMTWDNNGVHGWHIHHIIPYAHFDLTKIEEQQACCHYTNLMPMWEKEHRRLSGETRKYK